MSEIKRIVTNARRGRAVVHNGVVYLGGQAAEDRGQEIRSQTRQVLEKIDRILEEAGSNNRHVLSATIWLRDVGRDFAGMNAEWDAWIDPDAAPARATAQCEMGAPDVLIEILLTAAVAS